MAHAGAEGSSGASGGGGGVNGGGASAMPQLPPPWLLKASSDGARQFYLHPATKVRLSAIEPPGPGTSTWGWLHRDRVKVYVCMVTGAESFVWPPRSSAPARAAVKRPSREGGGGEEEAEVAGSSSSNSSGSLGALKRPREGGGGGNDDGRGGGGGGGGAEGGNSSGSGAGAAAVPLPAAAAPLPLRNRHVCTLREWIGRAKSQEDLIVQASTVDGCDGWTANPIGMGSQFMRCPALALRAVEDKPGLLLVAFKVDTDRLRKVRPRCRAQYAETLARQGFVNQELPPEDYFGALGRHKFVASPEGNGVDCHRHYEALMAGSVPIVERYKRVNDNIENKYRGCPVLWTTDFSEVTEDYLRKAHAAMLDTEYDFSRLFLSSYPPAVQAEVRARGNHWCLKMEGRVWYQ